MEESTITAFTIQDLSHIEHMQPEDWDDIRKEFLRYTIQPFCKPIKVSRNGQIIGLGALILHQDSAWLGHIIVTPNSRGLGIGKKIVNHLLDLAHSQGIYTIHLIATDLGAPVYRKAGFKEIGQYASYRKTRKDRPLHVDSRMLPMTPLHRQQVLQLDMESTGENRTSLLDPHLSSGLVFENKGEVEGYYLPYLGQGPIYARTEQAGLALMRLKYATVELAILPYENVVGASFLKDNGFEMQEFTALRMQIGKTTWSPQNIYSRIGGNHG